MEMQGSIKGSSSNTEKKKPMSEQDKRKIIKNKCRHCLLRPNVCTAASWGEGLCSSQTWSLCLSWCEQTSRCPGWKSENYWAKENVLKSTDRERLASLELQAGGLETAWAPETPLGSAAGVFGNQSLEKKWQQSGKTKWVWRNRKLHYLLGITGGK